MALGTAHSVSLPLLSFLQKLDGLPPVEAAPLLRDRIEVLELTSHICGVIVFHDGISTISIEAQTAFGTEIVTELVSCLEFLPCPPGTCEYVRNTCRWCGGARN